MKRKRKNHFNSVLSYTSAVTLNFSEIINQQRMLQETICRSLPDHFSAHITNCIKKEKTIIIFTSSATWASQLRFLNQPIMAALRANGENDISETKIRVLPKSLSPKPHKRPAKKLSATSLNIIHSNALALTNNSELASAFLRLHNTLKNKMS